MQKKLIALFLVCISAFSIPSAPLNAGGGSGWGAFFGGAATGALVTSAVNRRPREKVYYVQQPQTQYVQPQTKYVEVPTIDRTETKQLKRRIEQQEEEIRQLKKNQKKEMLPPVETTSSAPDETTLSAKKLSTSPSTDFETLKKELEEKEKRIQELEKKILTNNSF